MFNLIKRFWADESGMGTVEIILIVAVLMAIALIFGNAIKQWVIDNLPF